MPCDPRIAQAGAERRPSGGEPPAPEDVLIAWLLRLPPGADPAAAARAQLARLPPAGRDGPRQRRLRDLLTEVAGQPPTLNRAERTTP